MKAAVLLALVAPVLAIDNGIGLTPPMGWRSWNCYHSGVTQALMEKVMDKMAEKSRTVNGKVMSIADLGYVHVGLDDNWQACGKGVNGSFHDADGNPIINTATFPSMKNMTDHGHSLGLSVGWYMNNCICKETQFTDPTYIAKHMQQSAKAVADFGFDGVKLDGCGEFRNLTWWGDLLNATGRPIMIENCHWGQTVPGQTSGDAPCTGTTMPSNCPYNFFRTCGDINNHWDSMFANLQTTTPYQDINTPLARPGAWAYPDMLEVGNLANHNEDRAHFGAWCIVSAPLILGYDVTNEDTTDRVWDIISNTEAIAVNQAWAGHPGRLVHSVGGSSPTTQLWSKPVSTSSVAAFVINNDPSNGYNVTISMTDLGFASTQQVTVRDIWEHKDLGTITGTFATDEMVGHDSRFYTFTASN
eukprot:TRINITY_DN588_c0_g2_i3.p1 TRINITY_DN588_c0_g2~~TRINITY_DN588_c0_g2_i3.p1  ORF type:complete len:415 (+),score=162.67 TRINITY_DN588_c0_g2_i3:48-1292(+)